MKTNSSLDILYNKHTTSAQDDRTLEEWEKHEGRCHGGLIVAKLTKISFGFFMLLHVRHSLFNIYLSN